MGREIRAMTPADVAALGGPCAACASWQLDPLAARSDLLDDDARMARKVEWATRLHDAGELFGVVVSTPPGQQGHALAVPATAVPRIESFPTAPSRPDAVVLVALWASEPTHYKPTLHALVRGLRQADVRRLHAFAGGPAPKGCQTVPASGSVPCRFPDELLARLGFTVARPHPVTARYRLEVRSALPVIGRLDRVRELGLAIARPTTAPEPGLGRVAADD